MGLVGTILSLPYVLLFFGLWIMASLTRPLLYASLACLIVNPINAKRKLMLFVNTFNYMTKCNDKKWVEPDQPVFSVVHKVEKKTVIFFRHGESLWNETFNRGDRTKLQFHLNFLPGSIKAIFFEWFFLVTGQATSSWFYDSPLSEKGKKQAEGVQKFLRQDLQYSTPKEARYIRMMLGDPPDGEEDKKEGDGDDPNGSSSQLISSNLRRAISTMAIGLRDRLDKHLEGDDIMIMSELQEISFNPDALCITPAKGKCECTFTDPKYLKPIFDSQVNMSLHQGNKPINTNGLIRLNAFCESLFRDIKKENVICAGHSLWFRSFFRTFLPREFEHISKVKKLQNGACAGFVLEKKTTDTGVVYEIDPTTLTVVYGGFG
jgi:broad specificity phosphatase PhoE